MAQGRHYSVYLNPDRQARLDHLKVKWGIDSAGYSGVIGQLVDTHFEANETMNEKKKLKKLSPTKAEKALG